LIRSGAIGRGRASQTSATTGIDLAPDRRSAYDGAIALKAMGVKMGNFGDTLRQEREFRGITLDAITRVTKISNRHLVALEQEHFDVLPGGVFNKSMVREYARVVGLDQEEWVRRYLSAHRSTGSETDEDGWMRFAENASKARGETRRGSRPDQRLRWTGIGVLLLLVAGLTWFVWSYVHKKISLVIPPPVTQTFTADTASNLRWIGLCNRSLCLPDLPLLPSYKA
jgi:cytoskeleton protein RodZ